MENTTMVLSGAIVYTVYKKGEETKRHELMFDDLAVTLGDVVSTVEKLVEDN